MIPSLEGWPTKAKEAPSLHEVRLTLLDTNSVFLNGANPEISNFRLFEALEQVLKHSHKPIKNLGKNYEIRLESTSLQS